MPRLHRHPLRALLLLLVPSARACDTSGSVIDCRNADLTEVAFKTQKYDSVTFTEDASAVMTVPEKFADEVQAAVFQFACAGECKSLVLQGKQFYKVAHERASISITSAGDITFEDDAFVGFTTTGDVVISAAGSLKFDGRAFEKLALELRGEKYCDTPSPTRPPTSPAGRLPLPPQRARVPGGSAGLPVPPSDDVPGAALRLRVLAVPDAGEDDADRPRVRGEARVPAQDQQVREEGAEEAVEAVQVPQEVGEERRRLVHEPQDPAQVPDVVRRLRLTAWRRTTAPRSSSPALPPLPLPRVATHASCDPPPSSSPTLPASPRPPPLYHKSAVKDRSADGRCRDCSRRGFTALAAALDQIFLGLPGPSAVGRSCARCVASQ